MSSQLTSNAEALRLFFTEDIYLLDDQNQSAFLEPVVESELRTEATRITPLPSLQEESLPVPPMVEEPTPIMKKDLNFEFLGKNQKAILILVNDKVNKVSSVQGTELLRKLVKAIELTNNDFALVNYASYLNADYSALSQFFKCNLVLSFGVSTEQLGLNEQPLHQLVQLDDVRFIFAKNLHDLDSDQLSKKVLWASLQKVK